MPGLSGNCSTRLPLHICSNREYYVDYVDYMPPMSVEQADECDEADTATIRRKGAVGFTQMGAGIIV